MYRSTEEKRIKVCYIHCDVSKCCLRMCSPFPFSLVTDHRVERLSRQSRCVCVCVCVCVRACVRVCGCIHSGTYMPCVHTPTQYTCARHHHVCRLVTCSQYQSFLSSSSVRSTVSWSVKQHSISPDFKVDTSPKNPSSAH